jgi:hypothetical protein
VSADDWLALAISCAVPFLLILWPGFWYRRGIRAERRRWEAVRAQWQQQLDAANQRTITVASDANQQIAATRAQRVRAARARNRQN